MEKRYEILNYLCSQNNPVTSQQIQELFTISRRSIINYIKQLNEEVEGLILSSRDGYNVSNKMIASSLLTKQTDEFTYEGYEKRKSYILEKLLLKKEDTTVYQLSEELFVSDLTINKDIAKLKKELEPKGLYINSKKNRLFIIGDNALKNKYLLNMLNDELNDSKFSLNSLQEYFETVNISHVINIIQNTMNKFHVSLDEYSLLNYVLHIAICIETSIIQTDEMTSTYSQIQNDIIFSEKIQNIINDIYKQLKEKYPQSSFTKKQISDASILMSTRIISPEIFSLSFTDTRGYIGEDLYNLVVEMILGIYRNYGLDVNVDDFTVRFAFHLKNLVIRIQHKITLANNNFISIKSDYPFLYTIAYYVASLINKKYDTVLPENEISYIALHLGVLVESQRKTVTSVNCAILTYNYYNMGQKLFERLNSSIHDLQLEQIVSNYNSIHNNVDLILTTFEPDYSYPVSQIHVNSIPTDIDIERIQDMVKQIQKRLKNRETINKFKRFFDERLTYKNHPFSSKKEIIDFMCKDLMRYGFVSEGFKEDIYNHENIVPSEYNNVAMPHPLSDDDNHILKSSVSMWFSDKTIRWENNDVNIVFMISLLPQDRPLFSEIFNSITQNIIGKITSKELLETESFEDLINRLLNIN